MAKKIIKLTESDLHKIIKESVNNILNGCLNEGQGWDYFKDRVNDMKQSDAGFSTAMKELSDKETYKGMGNFIKTGDRNGDVDGYPNNYYYSDSPSDAIEHNYGEKGKPVNKSLRGKIGRAAGAAGAIGYGVGKSAYNSVRNRLKR